MVYEFMILIFLTLNRNSSNVSLESKQILLFSLLWKKTNSGGISVQ